LEDNDDVDDLPDIFVEPPEQNYLTDEDSADEDCGGNLENLSKRQLLASVDLRFHNEEDEEETYLHIDNPEFYEIQDCAIEIQNDVNVNDLFEFPLMPLPMHSTTERNWINGDLEIIGDFFPRSDYSAYENKSPVELFEMMLTDDIVEYIVTQSNNYGMCKFNVHPQITFEDMKCFIAILYLTGYNTVPSRHLYWNTELDVQNQMITNAMRRDRFTCIMRSLHCCDLGTVDPSDKMFKLRPLIELIKQNFSSNFVPTKNLSFDESMIKYFGKHGCKQFIRGKPIRFGYKVWCLNAENSYLCNFEIYAGKNCDKDANPLYDKAFGKPAAVFVRMVDKINHPTLRYHFFFDNLFTSLNLLSHLQMKGYYGTGTVRANRVPKLAGLPTKEIMKKEIRGKYAFKLSQDGLSVIKWLDNSVVTVASNAYGVEPLGSVRRYSSKTKKVETIKCPHSIKMYNKYMGGTDRMDEDVNAYRIAIRGKKWYWPIFTWLLDVCMNNAWVLHRNTNNNNKITNLQFRREVVLHYLKTYGKERKTSGRIPKYNSVQFDNGGHFVQYIDGNKRHRCQGETCKSSLRTECVTCNVGLCIGCFVSYHTT
jgi:DNA excision repair protein ERCC-6